MTAAEIIAASKKPVSEEEMAERAKLHRERLDAAQRAFEERAARMALTSKDLEKTCSL
jgi:chromosome segregation and condensation protein ScpB